MICKQTFHFPAQPQAIAETMLWLKKIKASQLKPIWEPSLVKGTKRDQFRKFHCSHPQKQHYLLFLLPNSENSQHLFPSRRPTDKPSQLFTLQKSLDFFLWDIKPTVDLDFPEETGTDFSKSSSPQYCHLFYNPPEKRQLKVAENPK